MVLEAIMELSSRGFHWIIW